MPVCREHKHYHFRVMYLIHQPVLLCNPAAPLPGAVAAKRFRLAGAGIGMLCKFVKQLNYFLKTIRLIPFQFTQVIFSPSYINYIIHKPTEN